MGILPNGWNMNDILFGSDVCVCVCIDHRSISTILIISMDGYCFVVCFFFVGDSLFFFLLPPKPFLLFWWLAVGGKGTTTCITTP